MFVDCPLCGFVAWQGFERDCPICGPGADGALGTTTEPETENELRDKLELHYSLCGRHALRLIEAMDADDEAAARAAVACMRDEAVAVRRLRRSLHLAV